MRGYGGLQSTLYARSYHQGALWFGSVSARSRCMQSFIKNYLYSAPKKSTKKPIEHDLKSVKGGAAL